MIHLLVVYPCEAWIKRTAFLYLFNDLYQVINSTDVLSFVDEWSCAHADWGLHAEHRHNHVVEKLWVWLCQVLAFVLMWPLGFSLLQSADRACLYLRV